MQLIFSPIPPSKKNSRIIICRGKYPTILPSKSYKDWHEAEMWNLKKHKPEAPIEKCEIVCDFYFPNLRRHDLTNIAESILDLLVDALILKDDSWTVVEGVLLYGCGVDKESPRVEVEINEL